MDDANPVKQRAAIRASEAPPRSRNSVYPPPYANSVDGRVKHPLGELFGLRNFGVNYTRLAPGAASALRHAHTLQDEFVLVLEGAPSLETDAGEQILEPGMCVGFPAGTGDGHRIVNRASVAAVILEVGDRTPGDAASYPDADLRAETTPTGWIFRHKDGTPY